MEGNASIVYPSSSTFLICFFSEIKKQTPRSACAHTLSFKSYIYLIPRQVSSYLGGNKKTREEGREIYSHKSSIALKFESWGEEIILNWKKILRKTGAPSVGFTLLKSDTFNMLNQSLIRGRSRSPKCTYNTADCKKR